MKNSLKLKLNSRGWRHTFGHILYVSLTIVSVTFLKEKKSNLMWILKRKQVKEVCIYKYFLTLSWQSLQDAAAGCGQVSDGLPLFLSWIRRLWENWEREAKIICYYLSLSKTGKTTESKLSFVTTLWSQYLQNAIHIKQYNHTKGMSRNFTTKRSSRSIWGTIWKFEKKV